MISADENAALLSAQRLLAAVHGRAVHGSAVLSFVIPSAAEGSAVRPGSLIKV
jgi:hypothetical protein